MTSSEYKNTVQWTLATQPPTDEEDILTTARRIFKNLGVPFPLGSISDAVRVLSSGDYMGWTAYSEEQALLCANNGYTAVGVTEDRIVIIMPEDETVAVGTALPEVSHPVARKLSEMSGEEVGAMRFFAFATLVENPAPVQAGEAGEGEGMMVAAPAATTCTTGCQVACQTGCQVSCQSCNTCQTGCQVACQSCNTCQTGCQVVCNTGCQVACQSCNTCQTGCQVVCNTGCQVACQSCNTCQTGCQVVCNTGCQVACQTGCQVVCNTGCQIACQSCNTCQTGCQVVCNTGCQVACQTCNTCQSCNTCQTGCEVVCNTGCQIACQTCNTCQSCNTCQTGCEVVCNTGCQVACQTCNTCQSCNTCQTGCEVVCNAGCQVACQTCNTCQTCDTCQTGCEVSCQMCNTGCQTCDTSCQTGCEVVCNTGCQVVCNTGCQVSCQTCDTGCQTCDAGCQICETYQNCEVTCQACNTCQSGETNPTTYIVSYDANGGTGAPSDQIKMHDVALTLSSAIPEYSGHEFLGWATSSTGAAAYNAGGRYTANASVILYAVWSDDTAYTVRYSLNGGEGQIPLTQSIPLGQAVTLAALAYPTDCYKLDHTFDGWNTNPSGTGTLYFQGETTSFDSNTILYAQFTYAVD